MAKKRAKDKGKSADKAKDGGRDVKARAAKHVAPSPAKELSGKDYDRELKKLHVELVKLQEWVKVAGAKIVMVFEGRDGGLPTAPL